MALPSDIQEIFFDTITGSKSVLEFEQWLYADKRLEDILSGEDYLELISYGYRAETALKCLSKLLEKHVDKGALEKRILLDLLEKALQRDEELPAILIRFYDLYCKGYYFLDNLGLGYGLPVAGPYSQADPMAAFTYDQQKEIIDSFYPALEDEIKKVISWIQTGAVILTGTRSELDNFEYIDNRTVEEKEPTAYQVGVIRKD